MQTVEAKLAEWRTLYGELSDAQRRLRDAKAHRPWGNAATAELEAQVRQLQHKSNGALDAVHAVLGAHRLLAAGQPPEVLQPAPHRHGSLSP